MLKNTRLPLCLATGILLAGLISVPAAKNEAAADPAKSDADYAFQGEYAGVLADQFDVGAQVIALGGGKFRLVLYPGANTTAHATATRSPSLAAPPANQSPAAS
jgi:hypothetical protein